jgi:hypothetical protein
MPTYGADLSKVSNPYDKFRQMVGGDSGKGRLFGRKFRRKSLYMALCGPPIVRPYLEIAFGYDKFLGLCFSDIIWQYLEFGYSRDYFLIS